MAYPTVQTESSGTQTSNATSWTATYPTGIQAGDLLLIFVAADGTPTCSISGWSSIRGNVSQGAVAGHCLALKAAGTETGNFTITMGATEQGAWRCFRISGWRGNISESSILQIDAPSAYNTGTDSNPNPPADDPVGWDSNIEDTLWFAACMIDTSRTISAYPTNYTNTQADVSGGAAGATLGTCRRTVHNTSEDPGTFTQSAADDWVAITIGVRPADVTYNVTAHRGTVTSPAATPPADWATLVAEARISSGTPTFAEFILTLYEGSTQRGTVNFQTLTSSFQKVTCEGVITGDFSDLEYEIDVISHWAAITVEVREVWIEVSQTVESPKILPLRPVPLVSRTSRVGV